MPQPLTERQSEGTYWNIDSIAERPECAVGVARVSSSWAFLEFELAHMFFQATGDAEEDDEGEFQIIGHPLAVTALDSLESLHAKLEVIAAGLDAYLPGARPGFDQLRTGIRACARERNQVVHAVWGINVRYPNDVIRVDTFNDKFVKYTPADFQNIVDRTTAQRAFLTEFDRECRERREAEFRAGQT